MTSGIQVAANIAFISLLIALAGCTAKPEAINYGEDQCAYCKMNIVDPKFGAELVTDKGRVYKFDAVECMVHYKQENSDVSYPQKLVVAYDNPKVLYELNQLSFMESDKFNSPMGGNIAAFLKVDKTPEEASEIEWEQVVQKFSLE